MNLSTDSYIAIRGVVGRGGGKKDSIFLYSSCFGIFSLNKMEDIE